jgi:hypothetical protein
MFVQRSGYRPKRMEVIDGQLRLVGLDTGDQLEMHHVPRGSVDVHGDHPTTVTCRQHGGHRDVAVAPQRIEPVEFGFDLVRAVVILPVHSQDRASTGGPVLHCVGRVLRQVQQAQRRIRREVVFDERPLSHVGVRRNDCIGRVAHEAV